MMVKQNMMKKQLLKLYVEPLEGNYPIANQLSFGGTAKMLIKTSIKEKYGKRTNAYTSYNYS